MLSPRLELDSGFSEAFERFDGNGRLSLASLSAGDNGLANLVANIGFEGSASDARGAIKLAAQRGRLGPVTADATRLDGDYRLWAGRGELALSADYGADSATLAPAVVAPLVAPLKARAEKHNRKDLAGPLGDLLFKLFTAYTPTAADAELIRRAEGELPP